METKTFKNAWIVYNDEGATGSDCIWHVTHSEGLGNPYGKFSDSEWDMEVTFTKKVKPIEVGELVSDGSWHGKVIHTDGARAWIEYFVTARGNPITVTNAIELIEDLERVS